MKARNPRVSFYLNLSSTVSNQNSLYAWHLSRQRLLPPEAMRKWRFHCNYRGNNVKAHCVKPIWRGHVQMSFASEALHHLHTCRRRDRTYSKQTAAGQRRCVISQRITNWLIAQGLERPEKRKKDVRIQKELVNLFYYPACGLVTICHFS